MRKGYAFLPFLLVIALVFFVGAVFLKSLENLFQSKDNSFTPAARPTPTEQIQKNQDGNEKIQPEPTSKDLSMPDQNLDSLVVLIDENTNWITYDNENCGFSISYPDYFKVKEKENCEIAFYYGSANTAYSFCPLVHLIFNNNSCGSLAYKGTADLAGTETVKIGTTTFERSDYKINGIILESHLAPLNAESDNPNISYYNGGETLDQANKIRSLFSEMVSSIELY